MASLPIAGTQRCVVVRLGNDIETRVALLFGGLCTGRMYEVEQKRANVHKSRIRFPYLPDIVVCHFRIC